jgi:predicted XRE-type DNA-binding protein
MVKLRQRLTAAAREARAIAQTGVVWEAICDTPEEAADLRQRADLMVEIDAKVRAWKLSRPKAAHRLGIAQDRLDDLLAGRISRFTLDDLHQLSAKQ